MRLLLLRLSEETAASKAYIVNRTVDRTSFVQAIENRARIDVHIRIQRHNVSATSFRLAHWELRLTSRCRLSCRLPERELRRLLLLLLCLLRLAPKTEACTAERHGCDDELQNDSRRRCYL